MEEIVDYYRDSKLPVYIVFITDGGISKTKAIKDAIRRSATSEADKFPEDWIICGSTNSIFYRFCFTDAAVRDEYDIDR